MRALAALTALVLLCLAGCGFELRGAASLPFETLYMRPTATPGVALALKRNIQTGTHTTLVEDPKRADAILELTPDIREKVILSLAATGRVREYQLRYRVSFRVHDGKGADFIPMTAVQLTRDVTYNDADVLAKESEEQLLYRDMQFDMVQQIMRRLAAVQPPKAPQ